MDRVRIRRNNWIIAGLAILLPGLGHWLIGKRDKAIFIISSFLFHVTLAYTLLHMVVIEQPLSIAYLMIVVPYHYFYAVFNSLQTAHQLHHYSSPWRLWVAGILFILTIACWLPIDEMYPVEQLIIDLYPSVLLVGIALYMLLRLHKQKNGKLYIARISAAMLLFILVVLLILQQLAPIQWKNWLVVLPIIVLIELLALVLYQLRKETRAGSGYTLDIWGICTSLILVFSSYVVMEYSNYPAQLLESFHAPVIDQEQLDGELGYRYELTPIKVPANELDSFQLRHLNGHVRIQSGDVDELTIYPVLYVQASNEQQALDVKAQTSVDVKFTEGISIESSLPRYSLNQYPRMNLKIIVPRERVFVKDINLRVEHGAIVLQDFVASNMIKVETNTAAIHLRSLIGKTTASTKNGSIYMNGMVGDIEAQSKKGDITLIHPTRNIDATALSGNLFIQSKYVNGNWNLTATVGSMQVILPKQANYNVHAKVSFGSINTDSLHQEQVKELSMRSGTGKYAIELYASDYILLRE
ncbi:DUF4097 domain-containing protein [Paenibacillus septentrionalis]|uniref:DUF4097 domain-containing protein n=1 Tax=Paenibacillus septentrionalis TaxID=429342 RepID=A0ABW1VCI9_9BACL